MLYLNPSRPPGHITYTYHDLKICLKHFRARQKFSTQKFQKPVYKTNEFDPDIQALRPLDVYYRFGKQRFVYSAGFGGNRISPGPSGLEVSFILKLAIAALGHKTTIQFKFMTKQQGNKRKNQAASNSRPKFQIRGLLLLIVAIFLKTNSFRPLENCCITYFLK